MGNDRATARSDGPTQGNYAALPGGSSWESRPWAAHAVAAVVRGGPIIVGSIAGIGAAHLFPRPAGLGWIPWLAGIVMVSQVAVRIGDRFARRLLPLSVMLRFSLSFPDNAPSRFATALRAGNVERLRKETAEAVAHGLPLDTTNAISSALAMIASLHRHDRGTRGHSERVRAFSEMLAEEMGLTTEFRERLRWGALLHDMGKLSVPPEILNKSGRPSEEEWSILQRHPAEGERILAPLAGWLGDAVHAAGQHHERWDGKGYPRGLQGEQISLSARIVAVADAFAVMTAARAYKRPLPMAVARAELTKNSGTQFDPVVVRAMLSASVGTVSKAAGPFAALGSVPLIATILAAAPAVPAVVTSGAAAAALTLGFAAPGSPTQWGRTVSVAHDATPAESTSPASLAFTDGGGGMAEIAPSRASSTVPSVPGAERNATRAMSIAVSPTATRSIANGSNTSDTSDASPLPSPGPSTLVGAMPTVLGPGPVTTDAPVGVTTTPGPQSTSTIVPSSTTTSTVNPKSTTTVAEPGTTTTFAPSETKPPPTTGVSTTTVSPPAETTPTTQPPPSETTPPIIEITTTTVSDTKGPKGPPLATTTTTGQTKT